MIEKDKLMGLLDKLVTRSSEWIKDAEDREDYHDVSYYVGQKNAIDELRDMINNWDGKGNNVVRIFEMQHQNNDIENYQSRIIEYESFQEYLRNLNKRSLPRKDELEVYEKHVDFNNESITFMFEHKINGLWVEFTHFAQVI